MDSFHVSGIILEPSQRPVSIEQQHHGRWGSGCLCQGTDWTCSDSGCGA